MRAGLPRRQKVAGVWQGSSTRFFLLGHWLELVINLTTLMLILETVSKHLLRATPSRPSLTDGKNFYLSFFSVCKCWCKRACACVSQYMCGCVGVEVRGQSLALFLKVYQSRPQVLCECTCSLSKQATEADWKPWGAPHFCISSSGVISLCCYA